MVAAVALECLSDARLAHAFHGLYGGVEYAEFEWPMNIMRYVVVAGIAIQVVGTILRRRAARFYVSLWYALAASVWTIVKFAVGRVLLPYGPLDGVNSAADAWPVHA